ncbi:hypothetical protein BKA70DRAFT_334599 [Coprinopsis sp. MPI-PUGE-AT-0042]|nr:hypothetical protein BKA70DRAFT_334599 [Coprinopsis sp. MPI-PUGE-AT-0042]
MATTSTIAAVVASNQRTKSSDNARSHRPAPLDLSEDDDSLFEETRRQQRRLSTSSVASDDTPPSPEHSALDSSAALILVHDDEEEGLEEQFDMSDDEGGEDDIVSPVYEVKRTSIPPLPPLSVFVYLLSPYLKLGALSILSSAESIPVKYSLPALFGFTILSAFSRQLWYLLARYMRKPDVMELVCDTFAKARGKERQRRIIRKTVKISTALVNSVLAIAYIHESSNNLFPLIPDLIYRVAICLVLAVLIVYLSTAQSLASRRIISATWLSILSYLIWFSCACYAHTKGLLPHQEGWLHSPSTWKAIFTIGFTFTTTATLPLYASLKSKANLKVRATVVKTPKHRSFRVLASVTTFLAFIFILPLVILSANPNTPAPLGSQNPHHHSTTLPDVLRPKPTPEGVQVALACFSSATLLLGVPQAILSVPPLPLRVGRTAAASRTITSLLILALSLLLGFVRSSLLEHIFTPLNIALMVLTLTSTYFVPAFLHISVHFFRRPLSIVIPRTPMVNAQSSNANGLHPQSARAVHDELLQRKERALQKKQFKKRLIWDVGAWVQVWLCAAAAVVGIFMLKS